MWILIRAYRCLIVCATVAFLSLPAAAADVDSSRAVIVCISGRGGATDSGMKDLADVLRTRLAPLGVPCDNVFRRGWNRKHDEDPSATPDTEDILNEIRRKIERPSYLAIIGHSYGGWAACRLSSKTPVEPDFVALIDPVFGSTNTFTDGNRSRGQVREELVPDQRHQRRRTSHWNWRRSLPRRQAHPEWDLVRISECAGRRPEY